jgi:hypothetical protein
MNRINGFIRILPKWSKDVKEVGTGYDGRFLLVSPKRRLDFALKKNVTIR